MTARDDWVAAMAQLLSECCDDTLESITVSVTWAAVWRDHLDTMLTQTRPQGKEALRQAVNDCFSTSLATSPDIRRYPSGAPSLRAVWLAMEAVCLGYGKETALMRDLLKPDRELAPH